MKICNLCGKSYKTLQALNSHIGWHNNPNRSNPFEEFNRKVASGEASYSNHYIKAKKLGLPAPIMSDETRLKIGKNQKNAVWSDERRKKHSDSMRAAVKRNIDSYTSNNVCGRVKRTSYNGNVLLGSWELLVAMALDDLSVAWTSKIDTPINYIWNNSTHLYFPDFYLSEYDLYIEVKGYQRPRDLCKWAVLTNSLIIKKAEIYNIKKYGSNELMKLILGV